MIYAVNVDWDKGDDDGKVLALVQAATLEQAIVEAKQVVRKMRGPGSAIVEAVNAKEMKQTVVLIPDGEKPKWLTADDAKDKPGQLKIKGTDPKS